MKSFIRKLHRWQLKTALKETVWNFPLRRGYEGLDAVLTKEVRRVGKWRFMQPSNYSFRRDCCGYWDGRSVYIHLKLRPRSFLGFFLWLSGTPMYFEGKFKKTEGTCLTGSYRAAFFFRAFVLILIYLPFFYIPYGALAVFYLDFQHLQRGDTDAFMLDTIMYFFTAIFIWLWWGAGYLIGSFYAVLTARERQIIYNLLKSATS